MASTARRNTPPRITIAEFNAFLDEQRADDGCRYELVDGEIALMTNPTVRHEDIVANIADRLGPKMRARGCQTYRGGTYVQVNDDVGAIQKPRPDLMVRCGETRADPAKTYITDPSVLIEVLSPSTERVDLTGKLPLYLLLPTARHGVMVAQDERRIEHWHRPDAQTEWVRQLLPRDGEVLTLTAVDFETTLDEVYADIPLGKL